MDTSSPPVPLVICHSHNASACHLTTITSITPFIYRHHYQSRMFFPEWTHHMLWLHIWSIVLNLTWLIWIPQGRVTKRRWPVNLPLIPFNRNHSHSHVALKYDLCNRGIDLGTYLLSRGHFMHILDFGTHFFNVVVVCTLHAQPWDFSDDIMFKQRSFDVSYTLICWPCL